MRNWNHHWLAHFYKNLRNFYRRRSRGFILEGFPRTSEEAKYLADSGLYPDGAVYLAVEDVDICNRLMPPKLERWKKQQIRIQEAKEKRKNEKLKQRVRIMFNPLTE